MQSFGTNRIQTAVCETPPPPSLALALFAGVTGSRANRFCPPCTALQRGCTRQILHLNRRLPPLQPLMKPPFRSVALQARSVRDHCGYEVDCGLPRPNLRCSGAGLNSDDITKIGEGVGGGLLGQETVMTK